MVVKRLRGNRGFTLIELIVVTGIIVVISTLMFANNNRFGGVVFLENLAYDVALSMRKAQVYGIAVRRCDPSKTASCTTANQFALGYGIQFSKATPTTYVLFADAYPPVGNGLYDTVQNERVESSTMQAGYKVYDLCATDGTGETCGRNTLDILFKRPEPDAYIRANGVAALYEQGRVILVSPRGDKISVIVEITGQIAVQKI